MLYEIAFTIDEAVEFATKYKLLTATQRKCDPASSDYFSIQMTFDYIVRRAKLRGAKLCIPFSSKYPWIIRLYSNYSMHKVSYSLEEEEKRVAVAMELLCNGQPPLWWWSAEQGPGPNR